jgi:DNA-binding response OmpR family regulator
VDSSEAAPAPPHRCLLLAVEDDDAIRDLLAAVVTDEPGIHLLAVRDGAEALAAFGKVRPDLVLLDLQLPGVDGAEVCRRLKANPATAGVPVVGFSAGANEAAARAAGCDDFVAKPFDPEELLVRIAAVLRRARPRPPPPARPPERIQVGQLTITRAGGSVTVGSTPLQLTPTEHRLLVVLADHADQVVPRATLLQLVWGYEDPGAGHLLDVHLGRLRLKLARARVRTPAIVTVRGLGFKLVSQSAPPGAPDSGGSGSTGGGAAHARLARA